MLEFKISILNAVLLVSIVACQFEIEPLPTPTPMQETNTVNAQFLLLGSSDGQVKLQRQGWRLSSPVFSGTMVTLEDYIEIPAGGHAFVLCGDRLERVAQSSTVSNQCAIDDEPTELNNISFFDLLKSTESPEKPYLIPENISTMNTKPLIVWNPVTDAVLYQLEISYLYDESRDPFLLDTTTENVYQLEKDLEYNGRYHIEVTALFDGNSVATQSTGKLATKDESVYTDYWNLIDSQMSLHEDSLDNYYDFVVLQTYFHGQEQEWSIVAENLYNLRLDNLDTPTSNLILAALYLDQFRLLQTSQTIYEEVVIEAAELGDLESGAIAHFSLAVIHHAFERTELRDFHLKMAEDISVQLGNRDVFQQWVVSAEIEDVYQIDAGGSLEQE